MCGLRKKQGLSAVRDGFGDSGSSLAPSFCSGVVGVAVVGGVWGIMTSERSGDRILGFSPSIPSLGGVWGPSPPSSCEGGGGGGGGGEGKGGGEGGGGEGKGGGEGGGGEGKGGGGGGVMREGGK